MWPSQGACVVCGAGVGAGSAGCGRCGSGVAREARTAGEWVGPARPAGNSAGRLLGVQRTVRKSEASSAAWAAGVGSSGPQLAGLLSDLAGAGPLLADAWGSPGAPVEAALFGLDAVSGPLLAGFSVRPAQFDANLAALYPTPPPGTLPLAAVAPIPPLPAPPAPDDPQLTAEARFLFLHAFSDRTPRHAAAPFHPLAFRACFLRGGPDSPPPDGWYVRTHTDPLFLDTLCWIGARMVRSGAYPGTFLGDYSHAHDLNGTVRALQKRVQRRVREGLERFWAEAADGIVSTGAVTGEHLRTPQNLALMLSLMVCAVFAFLPMGQVVTARQTLAHVARMWDHTGIEGAGRGGGASASRLSAEDWLRREHWVRLFWVTATFELTLAAGSETVPSFDVLHFPHVPLPATDEAFHRVMPSGRAADPPVTQLLSQAPAFRVREFFAWMDPKDGPSFPAGARAAVLGRCVADLDRTRTTFMAAADSYLLVQVHAFWKWASESASLGPLDVLVGEHLLSLGATPSSVPPQLRAAGVSETDAAQLLSHPHLATAVARLSFLRAALAALESALPASLLAPDPLANPLPSSFDAVQRHKLLAHLASVHLAGMLLSSPGPPDQLAQHAPPATLAAWSSLPAFAAAADRALRVSATMRALLTRFSRADHAANLQLPVVCSAASHAAAFHAVLLRRGAGGSRADFAACTGMLRASGRRDAAEAAGVLDRLAGGGEIAVGREVVLMSGEAADEDGEGE